MPILSKQQLEALNQVSFPDNNTNYITPEILRNYNTDVIDTLVDSNDTGSFAQLNSTNTFTQTNNFAAISASSFVSASNFIGDGSKLTNITSSIALPILDEGVPVGNAVSMNFSGSAISAQVVAGIAIVSVNALDSASFNAYTASNDAKVNSLINATGSYATTGSNTFRGDQRIDGDLYISGTNFIDIGDGSFRIVDAGNDITLLDSQQGVQLRNFTANDIQIEQFANAAISIDNNSGSINISAHNLGQGIYLSASVIQLNNIDFNSYSSSVGTTIAGLNTSASLALYTASFDTGSRNLTFTKGNTTQFSVNIPDVSGSSGNFATTGSNTFTGTQIITGSNGSLTYTGTIDNPNLTLAEIHANDATPWLERFYNDTFSTTNSVMSYFGWDDGRFVFHNDSTQSIGIEVNGYNNPQLLIYENSASVKDDLNVGGTFRANQIDVSTGSIQQTTGSYVMTFSGSGLMTYDTYQNVAAALQPYMQTGSVFETGSFATTGSNTFVGEQIISASLIVTDVIKGTGSITLQPDLNDARTLGIYNTAATDTHITASGGNLFLGNDETYVLVTTYANQKEVSIRGDKGITASGSLDISGSLTASLEEGYVWVGDSSNRTVLVATSSFGGGGSTINTGSFATTGSNSFNGNQTITGSLNVKTLTTLETAATVATPNQSTGTLLIFNYNEYYCVQTTPCMNNVANAGGVGWVISGDGITDGTVTSANYGNDGVEVNITSGNVVSGSSYIATGPFYPTLIISGSAFSNQYYSSPQGFNVQNLDGTGVQYGFNNINCQGADQTNLFSGIQILGDNPEATMKFAVSSYNNAYPGEPVPTFYAGGYYDSIVGYQDTTFTFYSSSVQIWMPTQFKAPVEITGSMKISNQLTTNLFTASLQNGYTWVGNSSGKNYQVATSSFGGTTSTGSLMRTGSVSGNVLTFTKGDATTFSLTVATGSTINTASFATTGSNSFNGNQKITGSLTISGSIISVDSNGNNSNVIIGYNALGMGVSAPQPLATGNINSIAIGDGAMRFASGSEQNIAIGLSALSQTTGSKNVAIGGLAMQDNTVGQENMAIGLNALNKNTTGNYNIAIGPQALQNNTIANQNVAIGLNALKKNTTGGNNFAMGANAMYENTTGYQNIGIAVGALYNNTIGYLNTAIGNDAGFANVSGSNNTYLGANAGSNHYGSRTVIIGGYSGEGQILNDNIILSDGAGNIKAQYSASGSAWLMKAPVNFTTGSNQQAGTATLDGGNPGTVTVSNSLVTANSIIMLTKQDNAHNGNVVISAKSAGTFTILSDNNGDNSVVGWFIINNS